MLSLHTYNCCRPPSSIVCILRNFWLMTTKIRGLVVVSRTNEEIVS